MSTWIETVPRTPTMSRQTGGSGGGIASCWRKQWQWLAAGLVVAAAMAWLALIVSGGQTSVLS